MCSMVLVLLSCALAYEQIVVIVLVDDSQDNTIWESLQYMTSQLVFVSCRVLLLCQRFRKFRLEFKWKGPFWFLLPGTFGITSGGGPHISVGIFQPKLAVPFLTNRFFALIREFSKRIENDESHFYWLALFNRKMLFHFPQVFPLISDRSVWHNGKHP